MTGFRRVYIVGVICFLMVNFVERWGLRVGLHCIKQQLLLIIKIET